MIGIEYILSFYPFSTKTRFVLVTLSNVSSVLGSTFLRYFVSVHA